MRPRSRLVRALLPWALALAWLLAIDAAITRTRVLWGATTFEHARGLRGMVFGQLYQASRHLYAADDDVRPHLALLGNSRIWLAARPGPLEAAVANSGGAQLAVDNLAIFGAGLADLEMVARHLETLRPRTVVVTLGASDLVPTVVTPLAGPTTELLATGWRDGAAGPDTWPVRFERWGRTLWPLFRFREFARAALLDPFDPVHDGAPLPDRFADPPAFFAWVQNGPVPAVESAYARWRRERTLGAWVDYVAASSPGHLDLARARAADWHDPAPDGPGAHALDALLGRIAAGGWRRLLVVMPENPILAQDGRGEFHRPGASDGIVTLIVAAAARHRTPVWDARHALGEDAFVDFDHVLPGAAGFEAALAVAVARADAI